MRIGSVGTNKAIGDAMKSSVLIESGTKKAMVKNAHAG